MKNFGDRWSAFALAIVAALALHPGTSNALDNPNRTGTQESYDDDLWSDWGDVGRPAEGKGQIPDQNSQTEPTSNGLEAPPTSSASQEGNQWTGPDDFSRPRFKLVGRGEERPKGSRRPPKVYR